MAIFNAHVKNGKVTVNVSPFLQKRLESYDLNSWINAKVESFKMNHEPREGERSETSQNGTTWDLGKVEAMPSTAITRD